MKRICVLGSTGSIGASALAVIARHTDRFAVQSLSAATSADVLADQVRVHSPKKVVLADPSAEGGVLREVAGSRFQQGRDALLALCEDPETDVVVNAVVGAAGLEPTLRALEAGKRVALANKESLVAAGPLVLAARDAGGGELVPIDSEHSAILQCLQGYDPCDVARIVLTASGGPFRGWKADRIRNAAPHDALQHPTWEMGAKITIDSATLANKALEVIEAHVLYGIPYEQIDVVVHPQSIIHSFVEFKDGSVLAQLGFPTMELPILYALAYPERVTDTSLATFDPVRSSPLTFEEVDHESFPLLSTGIAAGKAGGTSPAVFNAANEVAVKSFLEGSIPLGTMVETVREVVSGIVPGPVRDLEDVRAADSLARTKTAELLASAGSLTRSQPTLTR